MEAFLTWLQELPLSVWVNESESIWGYPLVLFLHTFGIALTGGGVGVILLRVLGVARSFPLPAFRMLFPCVWAGFALNAISGTLIFNAAATSIGYVAIFYAKMLLLLFATITLLPVRAFIHSDSAATAGDIPLRIRGLAAVSLVLWSGVITTGRLVAYNR
jgi:hypothetical protein